MKYMSNIIRNKIWIHTLQPYWEDERINRKFNVRLITPIWSQVSSQLSDQLIINLNLIDK